VEIAVILLAFVTSNVLMLFQDAGIACCTSVSRIKGRDGFRLRSAFSFIQVKENKDKIKLNNQLPYLVGNVVEVLEMQPEEDEEEDGANVDLDSQRRGKCVVLKTSTRQTIFLPVVGLVDADALKPSDLVGVNKVPLQPQVPCGLLAMFACIASVVLIFTACCLLQLPQPFQSHRLFGMPGLVPDPGHAASRV
jgi:hypothetical protein